MADACSTSGGLSAAVAKTGTRAGQHAGAALLGCGASIGTPQWTQTSGPSTVSVLSDKSQVLDFEAPVAGSYGFNVSFEVAGGPRQTTPVTVNVGAPNAGSTLTLRANHAVRMGGNVSVRAWPTLASGDTVQSIVWSQLEGPTVTLDTNDSHVALFKAPTVASDMLIRLRATLTTTQGATHSDEALIVVERYDAAPASDNGAVWNGDFVSRVHAYKPSSPYASALVRCAYDASLRWDNLCTTTNLPFLAQTTGGAMPTVEQVMDRVVVSHDWLGRNFETLLRTQDTRGDFRRMLMSVTAIVLGVQVRPSFYYAGTGAIYLDANNFWLTPEERDTVNEAPDFRSNFGADLNYGAPWRYALNNQSIFVFFNPRTRQTRGPEYLLYSAGWLMYHELGHALDFMPPARYAQLNPFDSAWGNIQPAFAANQLASNVVSTDFPLLSNEMRGLGQVMFQGTTANSLQRGYTPQQVAGFFSGDRATDDYAYSTIREDAAMLLEEFMMGSRLGIWRDFAVTDKITDTTTGSTLTVRWGQRGRASDTAVKPRVRSVVSRLTPWISLTDVDALPAPIPMRVGESWTANLSLPAPGGSASAGSFKPGVSLKPWPASEDGLAQAWQDQMSFGGAGGHHRHVGAKPLPVNRPLLR